MATLTSANSTLSIGASNLYPVAQTMKGYATNDAFSAAAQDMAEVVMGVDGIMSYGYTPSITQMTLTFQSDSQSLAFWEDLINAEAAALEKYELFGSLYIPGISRRYTLTRGVLQNAPKMPTAQKILQPMAFIISWNSVTSEVA